ncbi:molybdopterin synthase catalytic subunit-like [Amblyomma americanum]
MNYVELLDTKLDVEAVLAQVGSPDCGAISVFLGTTRNHFEGKAVRMLSYEAYAPMAKREMLGICEGVRERWTVKNIAVVHRLGDVPLCEASVLIAVSSEHRQEGLDAVKYAIDELKRRVPIWKKEHYDGGDQEWKANKECFWMQRP